MRYVYNSVTLPRVPRFNAMSSTLCYTYRRGKTFHMEDIQSRFDIRLKITPSLSGLNHVQHAPASVCMTGTHVCKTPALWLTFVRHNIRIPGWVEL